jgi:hypothetical protein
MGKNQYHLQTEQGIVTGKAAANVNVIYQQ